MTDRFWRILIAPGPEGEALKAADDPWIDDRRVRLPDEHWMRLVDHVRERHPARADQMEVFTAADQLDSDSLELQPVPELDEVAAFLDELADQITDLPPLVPEPTDELPDTWGNSAYADMARDVALVFREALRRGEPYLAWVE